MNDSREPNPRITITKANLDDWPSYRALHNKGKAVLDKKGRLRYPHGAPVGVMVLSRIDKSGNPIYRESADEWFDPDSAMARDFKWPE